MTGKKQSRRAVDHAPSAKRPVPPASPRPMSVEEDHSRSTWLDWAKMAFLSLILITLWFGHFSYLNTLFENDRHFSHLADFEREMTYRTEMGLYYSYYKTIITAPTFSQGLYDIMHDNVTEHGHTINTLERFNLYPEVVLAFLYRSFSSITQHFGLKTTDCYVINRGGDLPPVESCEGIGNPHYFYIYGAYVAAGSVLPSVYLLGYFLGHGHIGGIVSASAFMFNHGEATRAQWTPPLRETFGYPIMLAQMAALTYMLQRHFSAAVMLLILVLNVCFMLCWQFSQFVLLTQMASLFVAYTMEYIPAKNLLEILRCHLSSFMFSYFLLFGNQMLMSSMYFTSLITISLLLAIRPVLNKITFRPLFIVLQVVLFVVFAVTTKHLIATALDIRDDNHIFDILKSKFTSFANFHTQLYTCAAEFDFLGFEYFEKLTRTALLPLALVSVCLIIGIVVRWDFFYPTVLWRNPNPAFRKPFAESVYHLGQLCCFAIMGSMIMRLKLFLTPQLCVIVAAMFSSKITTTALKRNISKYRYPVFFAVIAIMAYQGRQNVMQQLSIHGEYSNPEQEDLFNWINKTTKPDAVFAGTMPVMANLKLSTGRPIVNHPHYEHEEIRNRTLNVYSIYSKKPLLEVYKTLKDMGVTHYVYQPSSCSNNHPKPNCTYIQMWDLEDPENRDRTSLCDVFARGIVGKEAKAIEPFRVVYSSRSYIILQL